MPNAIGIACLIQQLQLLQTTNQKNQLWSDMSRMALVVCQSQGTFPAPMTGATAGGEEEGRQGGDREVAIAQA